MFKHSSSRWRRKAVAIKKRDDYLCQLCKRNGRLKDGQEVHHIYPANSYPELGFKNENLITLCTVCHNKMHNRNHDSLTDLGKSLQNWSLQDVKVINVFGSPCSGKSSWVKDNAGRNDLIFDWDSLAEVMTINNRYDHHPSLIDYLMYMRESFLEVLEREEVFDNAYVITTYPMMEIGQRYWDYQFVFIDSESYDCLKRLEERVEENNLGDDYFLEIKNKILEFDKVKKENHFSKKFFVPPLKNNL